METTPINPAWFLTTNAVSLSEKLEKFGIQLSNEDGNFRSLYDILKDLSEVWDERV